MTVLFTDEERKYIRIAETGDYRLKCDESAPETIKKSLSAKFKKHKEWLEGTTKPEGKHDGKR